MAEIAKLGITKRSIESSLGIVRILFLKPGEVFSCIFPFPFEHIETAQLEGRLRIRCAAIGIGVDTQSIFQVVGASGVTLAQEHSFDVWLKRALWHFGSLLHQLVLREGKCRVALVEYLIGKAAVNFLQVRQRTAEVKLASSPTTLKHLAERAALISLDDARS